MANDKIEKTGKSVIQHGKHNNRVYLMKLHEEDANDITRQLDKMAADNGYAKIFAKIPAIFVAGFLAAGYRIEAIIPRFYNFGDDGVFLGKYLDDKRNKEPVERLQDFQSVLSKNYPFKEIELEESYRFRHLEKPDVLELAELYKLVFETYPFPIHDPGYLIETMETHVDYYGVFYNDKLIGASSAEMDKENQNVEMTDFAVNPEYRGMSMAVYLLREMEKDMAAKGIKTAYTIARLNSIGMNVTFLKNNYRYSGTLINNTNISGGFESMNVLYKHI